MEQKPQQEATVLREERGQWVWPAVGAERSLGPALVLLEQQQQQHQHLEDKKAQKVLGGPRRRKTMTIALQGSRAPPG